MSQWLAYQNGGKGEKSGASLVMSRLTFKNYSTASYKTDDKRLQNMARRDANLQEYCNTASNSRAAGSISYDLALTKTAVHISAVPPVK